MNIQRLVEITRQNKSSNTETELRIWSNQKIKICIWKHDKGQAKANTATQLKKRPENETNAETKNGEDLEPCGQDNFFLNEAEPNIEDCARISFHEIYTSIHPF